MKFMGRVGALLSIVVLVFHFSSCKKDKPEPQPTEQVQLEKLSKMWHISSASLDGNDRTADFQNFTIDISGTFPSTTAKGPYSYDVNGGRPDPSPWPGSGQWSFGDNPSSQIIRNEDSITMLYSIDASGNLTLSFTCVSCSYSSTARVTAVNGNWVFVLTP